MAETLILIRHGEVEGSRERRFLGATDAPLTELGKQQGKSLSERLRKEASFAVFSSPLGRARETARLALAGLECEIETLDDLREIHFGEWEGLTFEEAEASDPDRVRAWCEDGAGFRFPHGESVAEFRERVCRAGEALARRPERKVVVFAHGGVIRSLICHYLGLPMEHYLLFEVLPASWTTIRLFGERGILTGLNDLGHWEGNRTWGA